MAGRLLNWLCSGNRRELSFNTAAVVMSWPRTSRKYNCSFLLPTTLYPSYKVVHVFHDRQVLMTLSP